MTHPSGTETILDLFDIPSKDDWFKRIEADLKGKSLDSTLWHFTDETRISPFAHRDDLVGASNIGYSPKWEIAEVFEVNDIAIANNEILKSLQGGCETVMLELDGPVEWGLLFKDISLDMINTYVIPQTDEQLEMIMQSLGDWMSTSEIKGNIYVRPTGGLHLGASRTSERELSDDLAKTIRAALNMIDEGHEDPRIECVAHIGHSYFVEIARLRALRLLWQNMKSALGADTPDLFIEARYSDQDLSDDQHINMIAASTKALAAICGGVDRLIIATPSQPADSFGRRISRNVHHLLRYETRLEEVQDPVAGSFYIESLTSRLAKEAWAKVIEK